MLELVDEVMGLWENKHTGKHGVCCVTDDDQLPLCPSGHWGAVQQGPALDVCCFAFVVLA